MSNLNLLVTDYQKSQARLLMRSARTTLVNTGYIVDVGNTMRMLKTDPTEDSIDGITNLITQQYFRGRYVHAITISMFDTKDNFHAVDVGEFDKTMEILENAYNEEHSVLFINIVPRQIYQNSTTGEAEAENVADLFKRYGFIDIGCNIHGIKIPKYVTIKANDIGSATMIENEKEFW